MTLRVVEHDFTSYKFPETYFLTDYNNIELSVVEHCKPSFSTRNQTSPKIYKSKPFSYKQSKH